MNVSANTSTELRDEADMMMKMKCYLLTSETKRFGMIRKMQLS